jgi:hypothetical protein
VCCCRGPSRPSCETSGRALGRHCVVHRSFSACDSAPSAVSNSRCMAWLAPARRVCCYRGPSRPSCERQAAGCRHSGISDLNAKSLRGSAIVGSIECRTDRPSWRTMGPCGLRKRSGAEGVSLFTVGDDVSVYQVGPASPAGALTAAGVVDSTIGCRARGGGRRSDGSRSEGKGKSRG